ncbi:XdhC family protein [Robbsia sp. KACC 23696]|uniref:XdhC family protein n=1 Tax=Robbsia sp. KACC 23696 TaxID=3149231 RepID=UPI00325AEFCF
MDNVDLTVIETAEKWRRAGQRVILGTVVRTWGSAPRPVGSMVAVRDDGLIVGSVSGGCIEDDLADRAIRGVLTPDDGLPCVVRYGVDAEEAQRFGLPCGGTLVLVLEPIGARSALADLIAALRQPAPPRTAEEITGVAAVAPLGFRRTLLCRDLDMRTGAVRLRDGTSGAAHHEPDDTVGATDSSTDVDADITAVQPRDFAFDGKTLTTLHGAAYRMVLIGAGEIASHLARMAVPLGYQVIVCEPREQYAGSWEVDGVDLTRAMPDDVVLGMGVDARTAIIALTHDPKLDDLALIDALQSEAFYVGAIGSRGHREQRVARLALFDVSPEQLDTLHSPVGLYLGAQTPAEIAVSILAEVTAYRHNVPVLQSHAIRARAKPERSVSHGPDDKPACGLVPPGDIAQADSL